jgi:hypothetical protein
MSEGPDAMRIFDERVTRGTALARPARLWSSAQRPAIWLAIHCHLTLLPLLVGFYFFDTYWIGALYFIWPFPLLLLGIAFAGLHSTLKLISLLFKVACSMGGESRRSASD